MTSLYLKCDKCGTTLGMEQVFKDKDPHWSMGGEFIEKARALGWVHVPDRITGSDDRCQDCAASPTPFASSPPEPKPLL